MANQFQKGLNIQSYEELIQYTPDKEAMIVRVLRELILSTIPDVTEKISYNTLFYSLRKNFCFIWPASIPWGNISEGVALGFTQADLLSSAYELEFGQRKNVGRLIFRFSKDIDQDMVRAMILDASITAQ